MGQESYGVLLVTGARTHQENYAEGFAKDPRCRLVAVADEAAIPPQREQWNRQFAETWELPYIRGLDEALDRRDVQIVSVCAEHERRGRVAAHCAEAGKHLYLDKPIACSVQDADAVVEAVERAGVRTQMFSFTHAPWAQRAKEIVASGQLGELLSIHCDVMFAKGEAGRATLGITRLEDPQPSRFTFLDSKHELRATGVYSVALIHWLTQRAVESVYCVTSNYFFAEHQRNDVEDFGTLSLTLEGGLTATVSAGRIGWMSHPHSGPMRLHLLGARGRATVDAHRPRLEIFADEPPWTKPTPHPEDPMGFWSSTQAAAIAPKRGWIALRSTTRSDVSHFIDCIEARRESEMSARDGAALVETLMAGYVSAARGEVVHLPLSRE